jgi:RNA polymerase sigma-70 factor (ECF subfamily)
VSGGKNRAPRDSRLVRVTRAPSPGLTHGGGNTLAATPGTETPGSETLLLPVAKRVEITERRERLATAASRAGGVARPQGVPPNAADEAGLIRRLRAGDEEAFATLVDLHHAAMVRLARGYVRSRAVAEEVAQEAWLGLLRGIDGFEERSSLRTWLFRIVVNRAISTGLHERRHLPVDDGELQDDNGRFSKDGWWVTPPAHWADEAIDRITAPELAARIRQLIDDLPPGQRQVVTLRDVEGLSRTEVCDILGISQANQRVLLHRGRARLRRELEQEVLL